MLELDCDRTIRFRAGIESNAARDRMRCCADAMNRMRGSDAMLWVRFWNRWCNLLHELEQ